MFAAAKKCHYWLEDFFSKLTLASVAHCWRCRGAVGFEQRGSEESINITYLDFHSKFNPSHKNQSTACWRQIAFFYLVQSFHTLEIKAKKACKTSKILQWEHLYASLWVYKIMLFTSSHFFFLLTLRLLGFIINLKNARKGGHGAKYLFDFL